MARKVRKPKPTPYYGPHKGTDGGPTASDPWRYRDDGIYGPKRPAKRSESPVRMPRHVNRRTRWV